MKKDFESKVANLVALTRQMEVSRILMLRRLTLNDPQSLQWASQRQLELIFNVILTNALQRMSFAALEAAGADHFDPLLPPGDDKDQDAERWMLFDLAKPLLAGATGAAPPTETTQAVMDELHAENEAPPTYEDFPSLFDESITRHARAVLRALGATGSRVHIPPPFIVAPSFALCYERVLREMVLPTMRSSKRLREMAVGREWSDEGAAGRLLGMVLSSDPHNPVLHQWNARWEALDPKSQLKDKDGKPRGRLPEDDPWPLFREDAAKFGYIPPYPSDIPMLQRIIRMEPELLSAAWHSLAQLYEQEFQPKTRLEQARPGAFRDGLIATMERLDSNGGDLLAIRAFFDLPKVDRMFVKQLIQTLGQSNAERERKAPLLIAFYNDLPR
ncbi:hypothetical protein [Magnetospirillum sp. UT-4]|uniref:hypothetical protein n=1 Tax=Magnetospirillum sp. UT-4 TaxID=2681467 RepID=UPI00137F4F29|nr:hypothetical protein [Magnetospirillum sp. UT-4]CAA7623127.1 conserved hypothetical protein [Magnetospirillum sp. UT-4]